MSDYSKQTVAQLRQLLKERGIPSTGLQRKAQIIEKLEEADGASAEADEPEALPAAAIETEPEPAPLPVPAATTDAIPETVSHIDSDVPPPDQIKTIAQPAEDTTAENDTLQPATVFSAPPADPEEAVGPKVTEPTDDNAADDNQAAAQDELPDAPGPAAEALRFAQHEPEALHRDTDDASEDKTASPAPNEKPSVEKADLLPIPERSTAATSRLNTEELEADSKKRKRRSGTPELPSQDIKAKKHRPSQDPAPEIHLKEDDDVVMEQGQPAEHVTLGSEDKAEEANGAHGAPGVTDSLAVEPDIKRARKENVSRYKDLVNPTTGQTPMEAIIDDRPTVPALHPVTAALYIRNFMRPLRPEPLRAHLVSLASPPSSSPDSTVVKSLFLDAMKTHALVSFTTTTAASRVRASLHGSIWPPEGNRKELWVDFIPDDRVDDWIKEEEDAILAEKEARTNGRSIPPKRFEVVYEESGDNDITAVFQEVGSSAPFNAPRGPRASVDVRRPSTQHPVAPFTDSRQDIEASFKTLDELFRSTTAKPQIFYLPVSDDISDARLKELDNETSRDWAPDRKGRGIKTERRYKYSFDDEDRIVEIEEDRDPWSEMHRGGRGGFRGRGRGGGFARGRGGDSWRG
ncbi:hypothetical protein N0V83_009815 [Neocucurbitaria cava]|uniref:SAP domain-containing protein n=1 Tax=Neocucurbitaria cava TaxID=798079 RepID=A0A9W8XZS6_9PLEO|nr:hypothetical protein N0V83_009815 [Neocucurbitaria cava]